MVSTTEQQAGIAIGDALPIRIGSEDCTRQIALAERELNAFFRAVQELYGDSVAVGAANHWVTVARCVQGPVVQGFPDWRYVTILASSRFATDQFGYRPQVGEKGGKRDGE